MTVTLSMTKASNPDGNGIVTRQTVMFQGQTSPGAKVRMVEGSAGPSIPSTRADARGQFRLLAPVSTGIHTMAVVATSRAGQVATASMTVTRADVIIAWNKTAMDAMKAAQDTVGPVSRNLAMVQGAIYDAVNDIERTDTVFKVDVKAPPGASPQAAASEAAYTVLVGLYPDQRGRFQATLRQTLGTVADGHSKTEGAALGRKVGAAYLVLRANDGSNANPVYKVGTEPGQWQPTYPNYTTAWGPAWGKVTPFAIADPMEFLPPPPPALDSPEYAAAVNQVESLGALDSTTRTADQTQIGRFWGYDIPGLGPPPILYNQVLEQVSLQQHNTFDQDARMFALADVAMADAGIVAWDAKYTYDLWRPITAIREADTDGNLATTADPTWLPLGAAGHGTLPDFTPPFPSYVSGHATFGGALFQVLTDFYGTDDVHFTLTSDELPGVTRSYSSFSQAEQENGISRIYLGIHYSFDMTNGIAAGQAIATNVVQNVMKKVR